jgi:hypothetical protein
MVKGMDSTAKVTTGVCDTALFFLLPGRQMHQSHLSEQRYREYDRELMQTSLLGKGIQCS